MLRPASPSLPPRQPITNPLLYGLNWIMSPRPALSPTPCPGSWFTDGEEAAAAAESSGGSFGGGAPAGAVSMALLPGVTAPE